MKFDVKQDNNGQWQVLSPSGKVVARASTKERAKDIARQAELLRGLDKAAEDLA